MRNFIHLSALNIDKTKESSYANSKINGEEAIKDLFSNCVIVRPSVVLEKEMDFTNFSRYVKIQSISSLNWDT